MQWQEQFVFKADRTSPLAVRVAIVPVSKWGTKWGLELWPVTHYCVSLCSHCRGRRISTCYTAVAPRQSRLSETLSSWLVTVRHKPFPWHYTLSFSPQVSLCLQYCSHEADGCSRTGKAASGRHREPLPRLWEAGSRRETHSRPSGRIDPFWK